MPDEIVDRPKRGFGVPLDRWFREDLRGYVASTLGAPDARVKAHLDPAALDRMLAEHDAARAQPRARAVDAAHARGVPAPGGLVRACGWATSRMTEASWQRRSPRFVAWALDRDVAFELLEEPQPGFDVVVVSTAADLTRWRDAPRETKIIYDLTDDYLGLPDAGFKNRGGGSRSG